MGGRPPQPIEEDQDVDDEALLEGYDNKELDDEEAILLAKWAAAAEYDDLVDDASTAHPPSPPVVRAQNLKTLKTGSAAWRSLNDAHPELVVEMCRDFSKSSYKAMALKYEAQLITHGFGVPPQQTLSRWAINVAKNQPARDVQGGHRKAILSEEDSARLVTTIDGIRDAGGKVGWRLLSRLVRCLLTLSGIVYVCHGATFPSVSWCCTFFTKHGFSKRRVTKASRRVKPEDFDEIQKTFMLQIAHDVGRYKVAKAHVINFDETGVLLFKQGDSTMARTGSSQVPLFGAGDKRQFTVTNCGSAAGAMPPLQIIFAGVFGKKGAIPKLKTPIPGLKGALLTQTPSHWQTEGSMLEYMEKIILPWMTELRRDAGDPTAHVILLVDVFSAHLTVAFRQWCRKNHILLHYIYPGLTGDLQPMDIAIQGPFKEDVTHFMEDYYAKLLTLYMEAHGGKWDGFEFGMKKSDLSVPFLEALGEAYVTMCTTEDGRKRHERAWRQFEICWDPSTQAEATARFEAGTLYPKAGGGARSKAVIIEAMIKADALAAEDEVDEALEEEDEAIVMVAPSDVEAEEEDVEPVEERDIADIVEEQGAGSVEEAPVVEMKQIEAQLAEYLVKAKTTVAGVQYLVHFKDLPCSNDEWWSKEELEDDGLESLIAQFDAACVKKAREDLASMGEGRKKNKTQRMDL